MKTLEARMLRHISKMKKITEGMDDFSTWSGKGFVEPNGCSGRASQPYCPYWGLSSDGCRVCRFYNEKEEE